MSNKYKFLDQDHLHFVTCTSVFWIDLFIRDEYRNILTESLKYCQQNKGLAIYGYCVMPSHMHLIIGRRDTSVKLEHVIRDFKRHTSTQIHKLLLNQNQVLESRKKWMLWMMQLAGKRNSNNNDFQFWQQDNHPIEIYTSNVFHQKLDYIHDNPFTSGFVSLPEHWLYSSARNYANMHSALEIEYPF